MKLTGLDFRTKVDMRQECYLRINKNIKEGVNFINFYMLNEIWTQYLLLLLFKSVQKPMHVKKAKKKKKKNMKWNK